MTAFDYGVYQDIARFYRGWRLRDRNGHLTAEKTWGDNYYFRRIFIKPVRLLAGYYYDEDVYVNNTYIRTNQFFVYYNNARTQAQFRH